MKGKGRARSNGTFEPLIIDHREFSDVDGLCGYWLGENYVAEQVRENPQIVLVRLRGPDLWVVRELYHGWEETIPRGDEFVFVSGQEAMIDVSLRGHVGLVAAKLKGEVIS